MASLRKQNKRQTYYARIQWRDIFGRLKEKCIPLKTHLKSEALTRLSAVEKQENNIKEGLKFTFPWLNEDVVRTTIVRRTLQEAIDRYHLVKESNGILRSSIDRSKVGLKSLTNVIGKDIPVDSLNGDHIEEWATRWKNDHRPNTRACNRAKIVSFLNYCYKKKWINNKIEIDTINNTQTEKRLVNEETIKKIQKLPSSILDPHYLNAFYLYFTTGFRRAEPFDGELKKNYLVVTCETAKSKKSRKVKVSHQQKLIIIEMKDRYEEAVVKYKYKPRSVHDRYRRQFKKACRAVGVEGLKLHNLRNSYISLRIAVTGDIFAVSQEVGHASAKQTEEYALPPLLVADEFSSYKKLIEDRLRQDKMNKTFYEMLEDDFIVKSDLKEHGLKELHDPLPS